MDQGITNSHSDMTPLWIISGLAVGIGVAYAITARRRPSRWDVARKVTSRVAGHSEELADFGKDLVSRVQLIYEESRKVLDLIQDVRARGLPIVLISHNMPHVFEVTDRIHIHRLGRRLCVIDPKDHSMSDAVAFMTGAKEPPQEALAA